MIRLSIAALSGFVLALALGFGGLTRPDVIMGWVDVFAGWNPQMGVFFLPATLVYHAFTRVHARRQRAAACPPRPRIDARLVLGASIFGIGWAVAGACPGPALASLGAGAPWAAIFVGAMAGGFALADVVGATVP